MIDTLRLVEDDFANREGTYIDKRAGRKLLHGLTEIGQSLKYLKRFYETQKMEQNKDSSIIPLIFNLPLSNYN